MSHEQPCTRPASLDDVSVLLDMMEDFNALEGIDWSREAGEHALRTLLASPDLGFVGLVVLDDRTAGYFVLTWGFDLEWSGRDAFLTELYVVPRERGRRLGLGVLQQVEEVARANAARALHLVVRPENEPARRLYIRAGYERPPHEFMTKTLPRE